MQSYLSCTQNKNYARLITLDMIYKRHHKKAHRNENLAARKLVSDAITSLPPAHTGGGGGLLSDETTKFSERARGTP
jgi:hypothetical protein